ncbi:hypothetical protein V1514DRAFT_348434 [Lipomyces japonicus]|uniref:uncharacterized protein n=1 Tax=Lipomyces japonicus TaxID=56871 RepID=UPI0034D0106B
MRQRVKKALKEKSLKKSNVRSFNNAKKQARTARPIDLFSKKDSILLVGEGDFSFTKSLLLPPHSHSPDLITATAFDSKETLQSKYPDTASQIINYIEKFVPPETEEDESDKDPNEWDERDFEKFYNNPDESVTGDIMNVATLLYSVDATKFSKQKYFKNKKFDCCVFNFPHTGSGITDQDRNIRQNQELISGFLRSVKSVVKPTGKVIITIFEGLPYDLWQVKELAKASGFDTIRSGKFVWEHYDGYDHRKTAGVGETTKKASTRDAKTYIFQLRTETQQKTPTSKKRRRDSNSTSSSDSE